MLSVLLLYFLCTPKSHYSLIISFCPITLSLSFALSPYVSRTPTPSERFRVGQNVAATWTYEVDEGKTPDFPTQVEAWFNEVNQHGFAKGSVDPFRFSKATGHYTQVRLYSCSSCCCSSSSSSTSSSSSSGGGYSYHH